VNRGLTVFITWQLVSSSVIGNLQAILKNIIGNHQAIVKEHECIHKRSCNVIGK